MFSLILKQTERNLSPFSEGFLIRLLRDKEAGGGELDIISLTIVKSLGIVRIGSPFRAGKRKRSVSD